MANTIMTAKNTFAEGLIMDFAPDNTQATCMTSALNATLLTFNGNEMSLQNDMGNGRVETARLPEGYIPVGTCEFGDIIYVVSYNPLNDKALIGCFPSPERNISTEELYEAGLNPQQNLSYTDFLVREHGRLTGELKNTSVKKVLIDNKKLNPGDKYIIYTSTDGIIKNEGWLSDYGLGNTKHNTLPKYVKLHIVSIEDNGKITYLDTTTKWYDIELTGNKFYISCLKIGTDKSKDLDSYRNMIESNWSIFTSKHSGKLAILAELEIIDTFSCSYEVELNEEAGSYTDDDGKVIKGVTIEGNTKYKHYNLYLIPEWTSEKGIEPSHIMLTKASFNNNDYKESLASNYVYWANTEKDKYDNPTHSTMKATDLLASSDSGWTINQIDDKKRLFIGTVKIPHLLRVNNTLPWSTIRSSSFVYNIQITPARPFGRLDLFAIDLSIDFNKIGTGEVELTTWKYHNSGNTSILTFGIDAYPKPNWKVEKVAIQFYDNQGISGEYLLEGKRSYSGIFSENFGLDGERANSRLGRYDSINNKVIHHVGPIMLKVLDATDPDGYVDSSGTVIEDVNNYSGEIYMNDAGTIYGGVLYGVKIVIKQSHKDDPELYDNKELYRWYWTNGMFNEYYYQVKDFNDLNFELVLNGEAFFETTDLYNWKQKELNNLNAEFDENNSEHWKTYSANLQYIGQGGSSENNINMYIQGGLLEDYGCFNLHPEDLSNIDLEIDLGISEIRYNLPEEQYEFSEKDSMVTEPAYLQLLPQINRDATTKVDIDKYVIGGASSLVQNGKIGSDPKKAIIDLFNIYFAHNVGTDMPVTLDDDKPATITRYTTDLSQCYYIDNNDKKALELSMLAILFNKAYVADKNGGIVLVPVYAPIINDTNDMAQIGITGITNPVNYGNTVDIKLGFKTAVALNHSNKSFSAVDLQLDTTTLKFTRSAMGDDDKNKLPDISNKLIDTSSDIDFINNVWGTFGSRVDSFFLVYLGGKGAKRGGCGRYTIISGSANNYQNIQKWLLRKGKGQASWETTLVDRAMIVWEPFDINGDGAFQDNTDLNSVALLGMKFKNGMTILNSAFSDMYNAGFWQRDSRSTVSTETDGDKTELARFDNFAYQLFLLLTNTYTGGRRVDDRQMAIRNYVRNGDYTVELVKNITFVMKPKENYDYNIVMRGLDYKEYLNAVYNKFTNIDNDKYRKNVTLKLLSYAKNTELQIIVNSSPMSFFDQGVTAYYLVNGMYTPLSYTLSNTLFYVIQNGELIELSNTPLFFDKTDVFSTLAYIFPEKVDPNKPLSLSGAHPEKVTILSDEEKAYNGYLKYLKNYVNSTDLVSVNNARYANESEAISARSSFIGKMYASFPESISGKSKNEILPEIEKNSWFWVLFDVHENNYATEHYWSFVILNMAAEGPGGWDELKTGTVQLAPYYTFEPYNFLKHMKYSNGLQLEPTSYFSDLFGINGGEQDSAYTGFIKGIVLDKSYQIL